ncbi:MAG: DUF3379 domain-containing protein [Pseudomonadales bacterium]|nr:DUF3379 domain-containing protein [Pseudomonadales bacterium]
MNCLEFRQQILVDPYTKFGPAENHLSQCERCQDFANEIKNLDANIYQALNVSVPEGLGAKVHLKQSLSEQNNPHKPQLWLALAASLMAVAVFMYQLVAPSAVQPNPTSAIVSLVNQLAEPVIAHVNHKSHDFYAVDHQPISNTDLQSVLSGLSAEIGTKISVENVLYAAICPVDGTRATHLIVKDGSDKYTVVLIPDHAPSKAFEIDDELWRGYISPHPAGAIAVLAAATDNHAVARIKEINDQYIQSFYLSAER